MFYVYILASRRRGTLYVGVTSSLVRRVWQHREGLAPGFTRLHGVHLLVWFEEQADAMAAIKREKQLKHWKRAWKIALIERCNPRWEDRYRDIAG